MRIITILLCLLLSAPAWADEITTEPVKQADDKKIIVELIDSRRNRSIPHNRLRLPFGPKEYCYLTADGSRVWLTDYVKQVPDKRSWDKRRPIMSTVSNGTNVTSGVINLLKALHLLPN